MPGLVGAIWPGYLELVDAFPVVRDTQVVQVLQVGAMQLSTQAGCGRRDVRLEPHAVAEAAIALGLHGALPAGSILEVHQQRGRGRGVAMDVLAEVGVGREEASTGGDVGHADARDVVQGNGCCLASLSAGIPAGLGVLRHAVDDDCVWVLHGLPHVLHPVGDVHAVPVSICSEGGVRGL